MPQVSDADLAEGLAIARRELAEALERQVATSEVLRIISSSPGENATRLCGAEVGTFALYDGGGLRGVAVCGHSERYADVASRVNRSLPGTGLAEMEASRQAVQVADAAAEPAYDDLRRLNPDFAGFVRPSTSRSSRRAISSARS
jgi:hypothetical protein